MEAGTTEVLKEIQPPANWRRGVEDEAYVVVEGPRKASIVEGAVVPRQHTPTTKRFKCFCRQRLKKHEPRSHMEAEESTQH
jgi:hypothetical protein